jgi:LysM repeat protein
MVGRSRARYLAPIALVAVIAGTYLVVHAGLASKPASHAHSPKRHRARGKYARVKFYVVQAGDSLTRIATKTGLAVNELEVLNPHIDPNSLQTGQRLRLRR